MGTSMGTSRKDESAVDDEQFECRFVLSEGPDQLPSTGSLMAMLETSLFTPLTAESFMELSYAVSKSDRMTSISQLIDDCRVATEACTILDRNACWYVPTVDLLLVELVDRLYDLSHRINRTLLDLVHNIHDGKARRTTVPPAPLMDVFATRADSTTILVFLLRAMTSLDRAIEERGASLVTNAAAFDRLHPARNMRNSNKGLFSRFLFSQRGYEDNDPLSFILQPLPFLTSFGYSMLDDKDKDKHPVIANELILPFAMRMATISTSGRADVQLMACTLTWASTFLLRYCSRVESIMRTCNSSTIAATFEHGDLFTTRLMRHSTGPCMEFCADLQTIIADGADRIQKGEIERLRLDYPKIDPLLVCDPYLTISLHCTLDMWQLDALAKDDNTGNTQYIVAPPYLLQLFDEPPSICPRGIIAGLIHLIIVTGPTPTEYSADRRIGTWSAPAPIPDPLPAPSQRIISDELSDDQFRLFCDMFPTSSSAWVLQTATFDFLFVCYTDKDSLYEGQDTRMPLTFGGLAVMPIIFGNRKEAGKFPVPVSARHSAELWDGSLTPGQITAAPSVSPLSLCTGVYCQLQNGDRRMIGTAHGFFPVKDPYMLPCLPLKWKKTLKQGRINGTTVFHRDKSEIIGRLDLIEDDITHRHTIDDCFNNRFDYSYITLLPEVASRFQNVIAGTQLRRFTDIRDAKDRVFKIITRDSITDLRLYVDTEFMPHIGIRPVFYAGKNRRTASGNNDLEWICYCDCDYLDGCCNSPIYDEPLGNVYGKFRDIYNVIGYFSIGIMPERVRRAHIIQ